MSTRLVGKHRQKPVDEDPHAVVCGVERGLVGGDVGVNDVQMGARIQDAVWAAVEF